MSSPAPSSSAAGSALLVMRTQCATPYDVTVEFDSDSLLSRRIPELLRDNPSLVHGMGVVFNPSQNFNHVREDVLRDLHILLHLHDSCTTAAALSPQCAKLRISFVPQESLNFWFAGAAASPPPAAPTRFSPLRIAQMDPARTAALSTTAVSAAAPAAPAAPAPAPLRARPFVDSPLSYRFCTSLAQAMQCDLPTRVLFLPSLLWYKQFGTQSDLRSSIQSLLSSIAKSQGSAVHLYPPLRWDDLLEQKDEIYRRFKSVMLPAVWRPLQGFEESQVRQLALRLMHEVQPGRYVLKGSYDFASSSILTDIYITAAAQDEQTPPPELLDGIRGLCDQNNQLCFGLQPFVPSLKLREFRNWCVASLSNGQWQFRHLLTVRTSFLNSPEASPLCLARLSVPVDAASIACHDLVQSILRDPPFASLRDELIKAGCYAIRIDCGFDDRPGVEPRAFINEFTAPADAVTFCHAHDTELSWAVARIFAHGIVQLLQLPV